MPATTLPPLDWKQFEQSLFDIYWQQAQAFLASHPQEKIYALALNGLYREEDGPIYLPTLAANSEQAYADMVEGYDSSAQFADFVLDTGRLGSLRWNPPDWDWEELDDAGTGPACKQVSEALLAEATQGTAAQWRRTEARLLKVLINICKALTKACKASIWALQLAPQFAVLVFIADDEETEELARKSLGNTRFLALFPSHDQEAQRRAKVAALPADQQLRYHLACLEDVALPELDLSHELASSLGEEAEAALFTLDHQQVAHALLPMLDKPAKQWRAAMMLAQLAYRDASVVAALRQHLQAPVKHRSEESGRGWCASALGAMGDHDWLLHQTGRLPDELIAQGLAYPYRAWNSKPGTTALPLNYAPLEQALGSSPALAQVIAQELSPGSGFCELRPTDIDQALSGLQSAHALVRMHAAWIMSERSLGADAGKRILPALAQALRQDPDEDVRYQVMQALLDWKKASAKYLSDIEHAAQHDASEDVRELAQEWLDEYR